MNSTKLIVTKSAYNHLYKLAQEDQALGILIGLKKSGCSGYSYIVELVKEELELDSVIEFNFDDLRIFLLKEHANAFEGMQINYEKDNLNSRLVFNNPNSHSACGCGTSFQINSLSEQS